MSYDLYFWAHADGDPGDVLDAIEEGDLGVLRPDPVLTAFRTDLLAHLPQLADVLGPTEGERPQGDEDRYLTLTLPFDRTDLLPVVLRLARARDVVCYDPQLGEFVDEDGATASAAAVTVTTENPNAVRWTQARFGPGLGLGKRSLSRAWSLAGLPPEVSFGEAVGVFALALALRDGVKITPAQAQRHVGRIAGYFTGGIPDKPLHVVIALQPSRSLASLKPSLADTTDHTSGLARARLRLAKRPTPNTPGAARNTATSARQSPPSASESATSSTTFAGSCRAVGLRHGASDWLKARSSPLTRTVSTKAIPPACDTTQTPPRPRGPGDRTRYACSPERCSSIRRRWTLTKSYPGWSGALFS